MIRLEMKNYSMILTEKQPKYQPYHQAKLISMKYVTGEYILPSNQQQIIEQAKFTYSPLGKAFEKQIKTIADQGVNQIQDQGRIKTIKKFNYDDEDTPLISKQKEIFNKLAYERLKKITELDKKS